MKKLAIVTTHPIQYYAPVFKLLAKKINLKVFYTWGEGSLEKYDPGFGRKITWDLPLLEGYEYEYLKNISKQPGSNHFNGIDNPNIVKAIDSFNPDSILVFGWSYKSHLKVIRHYKGKKKLLFRGDSTLLDNDGKIKRIAKYFCLRWIYSHIDFFLYVGTNNKKYFNNYGAKESQLVFAPHAIDNQRFSINNEHSSEIRKEIGVKEDEILILFAGKFESKKDPFILLNAFLTQKIKKCHLLFVGNGNLEHKLKEVASISNNVHFVEFQNQQKLPAFYQACDIFCLPSKGPGETWGLAINEAMACGKAIITTEKVGCSVDLVINKNNGWIFTAGMQSDLEFILSTLPEKSVLFKMGQNSKEMIKNWSLDKIVNAIQTVIQ
jgi:glycosyltransferase involved in cell wall biosynthesis